jgi:restriction system protein
MNREQSLSARVQDFISLASTLKAPEAEDALLPVLTDLLAGDGVDLIERLRPTVQGVDYVARLPNGRGTIGVEYKHHTAQRIDVKAIQQFVQTIERRPLQRALLVSRTGFTKGAIELAHLEFATKLELLDFESLKGWAIRIEHASSGKHSRVLAAIRELSRDLARFVAANPSELDHMEWRDLERMVAAVL